MTATIPTLPLVTLRHLFTIKMHVSGVFPYSTNAPAKQVGVVAGGHFTGARLNGVILEGGSDWQTIIDDGTVLLDCRLVLRTDDGAQIAMRYQGMRAGSPEVLARIRAGDHVDPSEYYFRMTAQFETGSAEHSWLNRLVAVGTGKRLPEGPVYDVYEVL
ncbi:DUF3237 domain-containing protein [Luteibacter aegosomatissinici]|uniref:DUF3237 domain-containing protein n=1 Tax=Luteibacter aegosomatissinici TaxID=2911539 RepID=UPI001FFB77A9|nr:DUF3237 domain-containing protein [Luteibacter aegosomatissinici]UPG94552.1 DUF3237 domain-containing protein [Luteibacter aegosomatissinici]